MSIDINISSICYGKKRAIAGVRASLPDGSFTALIGRNGSGKSTLVGALLSLVNYEGEISYDARSSRTMNARERACAVSGILQRLKTPHITVEELVCFGRNPYCSLRRPTPNDLTVVEHAIASADVVGLRGAYLDEISGGELKRAYFAMLLAQDTKNIILDEATAFMDSDYENAFLRLVKSLASEHGKTVIAVVHSLELAVKYADNILVLDKGRQTFFGDVSSALDNSVIENSFGLVRIDTHGRSFFCAK